MYRKSAPPGSRKYRKEKREIAGQHPNSLRRTHNLCPHKPDLGDKNSHAFHRRANTRGLRFHPNRHAPNLQVRGHPRLLPWTSPVLVRCQPRSPSIHGIRRTQAPPLAGHAPRLRPLRSRRKREREQRPRQHGFPPPLQRVEDIRRMRNIPVPSDPSSPPNLRRGNKLQGGKRRRPQDMVQGRLGGFLQRLRTESTASASKYLGNLPCLREHKGISPEYDQWRVNRVNDQSATYQSQDRDWGGKEKGKKHTDERRCHFKQSRPLEPSQRSSADQSWLYNLHWIPAISKLSVLY